MELSDFWNAIRRHVRVWLGITVLGVLAAALVLQATPAKYQATAKVFVSASQSIPNSAQYVQIRVKSYPGVASSAAVLDPVISQLGLRETAAALSAHVSASVPVDTSEIDLVVADADPARAARIANAVATQTATAVERLETPPSGNKLVSAVVTDPATAPTSPASPVATNILGLGLVAGLFLGLAAAVLRSRFDRSVHDGDDVRRGWGPAPLPPVLAPHRGGRARRSLLLGSPALELARRLDLLAAEHPLDIALLSPGPDQTAAVHAFADELATRLAERGLTVGIGEPTGTDRPATDGVPRVQLTLADPLAPAASWRRLSASCDGTVLVLPQGQVHQAELQEMRAVVATAGIPVLAAVLIPRRSPAASSRKTAAAGQAPTGGAPAPQGPGGFPRKGSVPVATGAARPGGSPAVRPAP